MDFGRKMVIVHTWWSKKWVENDAWFHWCS